VIAGIARDPVASVLNRLRTYAEVADERARERVRTREAELGSRLGTRDRYEVYGAAAPLAVSPEVGELLYVLTLARRPRCAIEFGTSHGISAIYLAAALRDAGAGVLVSAELLPDKVAAARANLGAAGLAGVVEIRTGDALETLRDVGVPVDLVFLDGRNDLYLDVLRLLEPVLAEHALVLADLSAGDPDLAPYLEHVRGEGGYHSQRMLGEAGLEISVRAP
jgi:predicted O-methyltransferase YrrM